MTDGSDNVIQVDFANAPPSGETPELRLSGERCAHKPILLDPYQRKVTCRACGAVLDPYAALGTIVRSWHLYQHKLGELRRKVADAEAELKQLKREDRNARARIKRLQGRL